MSLSEAAETTRIPARHLRALEAEDFDSLGGDVYARGFLRSYAKALGLSCDPLIEAYRAEHEHPPPDEAALTGQMLAGEDTSLPRVIRFVAAACTIVLIFGLLAVVSRGGSTSATPPTETAAPTPTAHEEPTAEALPDLEQVIEPEPTTPEPQVEHDGVTVALAITDSPSWLRVRVDGQITFEGIQPADTTLTFAGAEEVVVRIGNAGAVELVVNGEPYGTAGDHGEVVELTFRPNDDTT